MFTKMKTLCLILLVHASLQLQCDKTQIEASVGGEFILTCSYDTRHFLYSKKYWCRGDSRATCNIMMDSDGRVNGAHRSHIIDARRRGLYVKITDLQLDDTGLYWVGIDKIYADIMVSVNVVVTHVPVSKPRIWPLTSPVNRPTCWGQPVTVRCGCITGTSIRYAWYHHTHQQPLMLHRSSDLSLHCGRVEWDSYYCIASNDISSQKSEILSVQVLMSADSNCIYVINIQDQPLYDCTDRLSTSTAKMTTTTYPPTYLTTIKEIQHFERGNQSLHINETHQDLHQSRTWTGLPLWYTILRWSCFASLLISLCLVTKCIKPKINTKRATRQSRVYYSQTPHLAQ